MIKQYPAYLFIGGRAQAAQQAKAYLKQIWCAQRECQACHVCMSVDACRYYLLHWLVPEKQSYTVEQTHTLMHTLSFALGPGEHCYIVFEYAEMLSINSAHTLLKVVEEPPQGYHFIFLAQSLDLLLPTLVSRCVLSWVGENSAEEQWSSFLSFFREESVSSWSDFMQSVEQNMPPEQEIKPLLELLLSYWLNQHKHYLAARNQQRMDATERVVAIIREMLTCLPLPGSGKIFWRTLFARLTLAQQ